MQQFVVLIDDDTDDLDLLKQYINEVDPSVRCLLYHAPFEAVDFLKRTTVIPRLIFIDFNLGLLTGDKILAELKLIPGLDKSRFLMLSTSMPTSLAKRLMLLGADFAFEKPATISEYNAILTAILKGE